MFKKRFNPCLKKINGRFLVHPYIIVMKMPIISSDEGGNCAYIQCFMTTVSKPKYNEAIK